MVVQRQGEALEFRRDCYTCPKCGSTSYNPHDVANFYCGRCRVFAADLRNEIVPEFAHIIKVRRTDCFTLAVLSIVYDWSKHPEARVCHAWLADSFNPGEHVIHAWCEAHAVATYENGTTGPVVIVHDYTQIDPKARICPRAVIYQALDIDELKVCRYTREEALAMVKKHGTDGPWEEIPR